MRLIMCNILSKHYYINVIMLLIIHNINIINNNNNITIYNI